jgi:hypothetical protein
MADDIIKVVRDAREQGWDVSRTSAGHWRFMPPDASKPIVITSGTPGDWRSHANFMAQMYRSGLLTEEQMATVEGQKKVEAVAPKAADEPKQAKAPAGLWGRRILEALQLKPTHAMEYQELLLVLRAKHAISVASLDSALTQLVKKGRLIRPERGFYKMPPAAKPMPPTAESHQRAAHAAGETTGIATVDGKLKKLDTALAVLADVEQVIRETRAELHELAEFRRKLKDIL